MGVYAVIDGSNNVINMVEWDGVTNWNPPTGCTAREADANAQIGGTWNGSAFVRAVVPTPSRASVLMYEITQTQKYNADPGEWVDKTADELAAEKLELKNLLLAELQDGDLSQERTQTLLRLERE